MSEFFAPSSRKAPASRLASGSASPSTTVRNGRFTCDGVALNSRFWLLYSIEVSTPW